MSAKPLTLIVAAAALNNGIGRNNDLPWRIRKDMAFFNKVSTAIASPTTDSAAPVLMNACIMGRRTWESIPKSHRPLDRRYNIIVTSSKDLIPADLPFCATAS
ncbi:dihydrofolate reductase, partial [Coemansia sp. RSA 2673]